MPENVDTPRAYSYLRFSTPEQAQGDSLRRQTSLAAEYAARHGLVLDETLTFRDLGKSAYRGRNATHGALRAFLEAVEVGLVPQGSYLLVESLDRLSRDEILKAQGVFTEIVGSGITLVTLSDNRAYSAESINGNPTDLILSMLIMIRAHEESATKARRLAAAWSAKRGRAVSEPLTAICPAWMQINDDRSGFTLIDHRAAVVRRIFDAALAGVGGDTIARQLNGEKVPTFGHRGRAAERWNPSYLKKILTNPATYGTMTPHRMEHSAGRKKRIPLDPVPNYYPAVVSQDEFDRVQEMRRDNRTSPARGRHAGQPVSNILGGLCRCGLCGGSMTLSTKSKTWRYLVCSNAKTGIACEYRATKYQIVEDRVLQLIETIIENCPPPDEHLSSELESVELSLDARRDDAVALADALIVAPTSTILVERLAAAELDILALERRRNDLVASRAVSVGPVIQRRLSDLIQLSKVQPLDRAAFNAAMRVVFSSVELHPLEGTLTFRWAHGGVETDVSFTWPADK